MIYLIGGAPRAGKSILGQMVASRLRIGWVSTDMLGTILRAKNVDGLKTEWDASPEAIQAYAEWFFPCLERFIWGANSMAEGYLIEGVDFLPAQVASLSSQYPVHSVFLGCSKMTLEVFEHFPGRSRGYAGLPDEMRRRIVRDVPRWSEFIRQECERFGCTYIDMAGVFTQRLVEAEAVLTG